MHAPVMQTSLGTESCTARTYQNVAYMTLIITVNLLTMWHVHVTDEL